MPRYRIGLIAMLAQMLLSGPASGQPPDNRQHHYQHLYYKYGS
jgi:hypothetical protein